MPGVPTITGDPHIGRCQQNIEDDRTQVKASSRETICHIQAFCSATQGDVAKWSRLTRGTCRQQIQSTSEAEETLKSSLKDRRIKWLTPV